MKVTVSLPSDDIAFLDAYASKRGLDSRSAAVQRAIRLLRTAELGDDYAEAWQEWATSGDAKAWEPTAGDGLAT